MRSFHSQPKHGYVNAEDVHISFSSLEQYVADIEQAVQSGQLSAEKKNFIPLFDYVGPKRVATFSERGISYLEFRTFDLNPYDPFAISQETLDTVHLFLLALLWLDQLADVDNALTKADRLNNLIAPSHPHTPLPSDADPTPILIAMKAIVIHFGLDDYYRQLIAHVEAALQDPRLTLSGKIAEQVEDGSLEHFGQQQGQAFHDYAWQPLYASKAMKIWNSTQMILFDAIQMGLNVEILDEEDQFLKLWHDDHIEYIKNGNMTSKDNYVVPLAMANKVVTKKIFSRGWFPSSCRSRICK